MDRIGFASVPFNDILRSKFHSGKNKHIIILLTSKCDVSKYMYTYKNVTVKVNRSNHLGTNDKVKFIIPGNTYLVTTVSNLIITQLDFLNLNTKQCAVMCRKSQ